MLGRSVIDICRSNCSDGGRTEAFEAESAFYKDAWQEEIAETPPRPPNATLALCVCSNSVNTCGGSQWLHDHSEGHDHGGRASPWGNDPTRAPWNDPVLKSLPVLPIVVGKAGKHAPVGEPPPAHSNAGSSSLTAGILSSAGATPDGSVAGGPTQGWRSAGEAAFAKVVRSLSLDDTLTSTTRTTEDAHDSGWDVHPSHWHGRCGYVLRLRPDAPPGPWLCHHFSVDGVHIAQSGLPAEHANRCAGALRAIDGEADSFDALQAPGRCMGLRKPDSVGYPLLLRCSRPPPGPVCRRDSCPYLAQNVICPYMVRSNELAATASTGRSDVGSGASGPSEDRESSSAAGGLDMHEDSRELPSTPGVSRLQGEHAEDS